MQCSSLEEVRWREPGTGARGWWTLWKLAIEDFNSLHLLSRLQAPATCNPSSKGSDALFHQRHLYLCAHTLHQIQRERERAILRAGGGKETRGSAIQWSAIHHLTVGSNMSSCRGLSLPFQICSACFCNPSVVSI